MKIRKYRDSDIGDVFEIYTSARSKGLFSEEGVSGEEEFSDLIEDEDLFLAVNNDRVVAFISVYPEQSFIHHLYVLPAQQKQGVGTALIDFIRNKYEHPLSLKCEKENKLAVSFYKKSGWKTFKTGSEIDGTEYILMTLDFN